MIIIICTPEEFAGLAQREPRDELRVTVGQTGLEETADAIEQALDAVNRAGMRAMPGRKRKRAE